MSVSLDRIEQAAAKHRLEIFGAFHPDATDGLPDAGGTLVLLGPDGPTFWEYFQAQPEYNDGKPDSLDRWSERVVDDLARSFSGQSFFPFGGPPYQPFIAWARKSGRAWLSPVNMLVHDTAGLFVSYRGAIWLADHLALPSLPANPCTTCRDKPCLGSCPAKAVSLGNYDVAGCHEFLDLPGGKDCMRQGCLVRRSCPVSLGYGRTPAQSAFHMKAFHQ